MAFELIEGPEGAAKLNQAMLLPPGRQLEDILGTPLFRRTLDALAPLGVPAAALQGFKPWALSIFLVFPPLEVARLARGEPAYDTWLRSEEHTSELQSLMRISYAVLCLKKNKTS